MSMVSVRRAAPGLMAAALLLSGCAAAAHAAPAAPAPASPGGVGTQPAVEQWFKRHEPQRIALQNALQQAYVQLNTGQGRGCAALDSAAAAVLATLPTPKHALDPQVVAGMTQFRTGAAQCLAGDVAGARSSLAAGAAARADADNEIEDILEAPNSSVN